MQDTVSFFNNTTLSKGLVELFIALEHRLKLDTPVKAYIGGGMAVHLYTGERVTTDIDAEFTGRLAIPQDLVLDIKNDDGSTSPLYFDVNYNPMFALMHERYQDDAIELKIGTVQFQLWILSPLDLAVSKLARYASIDREDIAALAAKRYFTAAEFKERATQALTGFIGGQSMVQININEACQIITAIESSDG